MFLNQKLYNLRRERKRLQETMLRLEDLNEIGLVRRRELVLMFKRKIEQLCNQEIELLRKRKQVQEPEQELGQSLEIVLIQEMAIKEKLDNPPLVLKLKPQNQLFLVLAHKLFPEDVVAELVAYYQQLKLENKSWSLIIIIILWNLLGLLLTFYIQIRIENIWLAQITIDD